MDRVFLDLGFFQIKWYSVFILLGIISGYLVIRKESQKKGISQEFILDMVFYSLIFGIIGARIYYVLFNSSYYWKHPLEIFMTWHGGLAIHGGIIGGLLFQCYYSKKKKYHMLGMFDILVVGILIGQSIGRWGNFFNQEAYGRIVSLHYLQSFHLPKFIIKGMYIDGAYREPTFLYESIASFIGFLVLLLIRKNKKLKTGQLTGIYLIWYGIERMMIETFRSDSLMLGTIKVAQLVSLIACMVGLLLIIKSLKENKYYISEKVLYKS